MNYEDFLLEKKSSVIKAAEKKAKDEMSSKGADRKSSAASKASGSKNTDELEKWGKAVWDVISKLNHGSVVKDTFNQSAADGTLQAAKDKGLVKDKKEGVTYGNFLEAVNNALTTNASKNNTETLQSKQSAFNRNMNKDPVVQGLKTVYSVATNLNPKGIVKSTFNQKAADGSLDSAKSKGLVK